MGTSKIKFGAQIAAKIEPDVLRDFIVNAEACRSTKDIVLRELVYAFNRFCRGGRSPVLQELEVVAPGYRVVRNAQGREIVEDATPGVIMLPSPGYPEMPDVMDLRVAEEPRPDLLKMQEKATKAARTPRRAAAAKKQ